MLQQDLKEGSQITLKGTRKDGSTYEFPLNHTYNNNQVCCRPRLVLAPKQCGFHAAHRHVLNLMPLLIKRRTA